MIRQSFGFIPAFDILPRNDLAVDWTLFAGRFEPWGCRCRNRKQNRAIVIWYFCFIALVSVDDFCSWYSYVTENTYVRPNERISESVFVHQNCSD
jgi:hypothetical protein